MPTHMDTPDDSMEPRAQIEVRDFVSYRRRTRRPQAADRVRRSEQYRKDVPIHFDLRVASRSSRTSKAPSPPPKSAPPVRHIECHAFLSFRRTQGLWTFRRGLRPGRRRNNDKECPPGTVHSCTPDLPSSVRDKLETALHDPNLLAEDVQLELKRCFDASTVSELIRLPDHQGSLGIKLSLSDQNGALWHFGVDMSDLGAKVSGRIENMVLVPKERWAAGFYPILRLRDASGRTPTSLFFNSLLDMGAGSGTGEPRNAYYLPAARGGVMGTHHIIASSLFARSARPGVDVYPDLPMVSGVIADFMHYLVLYQHTNLQARDDTLDELAETLEKEAMAGRIGASPSPSGYPVFSYRPLGTGDDIRLTRASSMVSELAPIVLFLRGVTKVGDTLIIEEPEAHLHPAAQIPGGRNAGPSRSRRHPCAYHHAQRLVVEGDRESHAGRNAREADPGKRWRSLLIPVSLHPNEVGIWLFRHGAVDRGSTVEQIPFDRSRGRGA